MRRRLRRNEVTEWLRLNALREDQPVAVSEKYSKARQLVIEAAREQDEFFTQRRLQSIEGRRS
jgi:hypothetical protein